jgi:hypothetical protein
MLRGGGIHVRPSTTIGCIISERKVWQCSGETVFNSGAQVVGVRFYASDFSVHLDEEETVM